MLAFTLAGWYDMGELAGGWELAGDQIVEKNYLYIIIIIISDSLLLFTVLVCTLLAGYHCAISNCKKSYDESFLK